MKLRNRKTGEVIIVIDHTFDNYNSLAELMNEWEDYKPAEPLIKDEKIRKAVRAWAEFYDNSVIRVHIGDDYISLYIDDVEGYSSSVGIDLPPDVFRGLLIDNHYYTLAELCGEEEE